MVKAIGALALITSVLIGPGIGWAQDAANLREAKVRELVSLLEDPSPKTREAAVRRLGRIGDEQALAALKDLLAREDDPRVAKLAQNAVERLERKAAKGMLAPRAKSSSTD